MIKNNRQKVKYMILFKKLYKNMGVKQMVKKENLRKTQEKAITLVALVITIALNAFAWS